MPFIQIWDEVLAFFRWMWGSSHNTTVIPISVPIPVNTGAEVVVPSTENIHHSLVLSCNKYSSDSLTVLTPYLGLAELSSSTKIQLNTYLNSPLDSPLGRPSENWKNLPLRTTTQYSMAVPPGDDLVREESDTNEKTPRFNRRYW